MKPIGADRDAREAPFDGSRNHKDIRTFYTSELDYLRAMRKRYGCQFCDTSSFKCAGCQELDRRIEHLASLNDPAPL